MFFLDNFYIRISIEVEVWRNKDYGVKMWKEVKFDE